MLLCSSNWGTRWSRFWWEACMHASSMPGVDIRSSRHYSFWPSWLCIDWVSCRHAKKNLSKLILQEIQYICQIPDNQDPHINHKSIVFIQSQERTRMLFPHLEIQSDLHGNYAAFCMNHGPAPQLSAPSMLARWLADSLKPVQH